MRVTTIRRRLGVAFLLLVTLVALGTVAAVAVTRQAGTAAARAESLAEQGYRLAHVAGLVREFYIHQAHLALGLHAAHHSQMARDARTDLATAIDAVEGCSFLDLAALRGDVRTLDRLFEEQFLPALSAGKASEAAAIHHRAVGQVDALIATLEVAQREARQAVSVSRVQAEDAARQAIVGAALVLLVTGLLALLVVGWLDRTITGPMQRLTRAAAALVDGRGSDVPVDGPAEVRALGQTLNEMLRDLEQQRRARSAAETMAALGRASAGIAHEINNPLGVILGHARLIERAGGEAAEDARVIAAEARLCQQIVQALLDYARPGVLTRRAVDLGTLLEPLCERWDATLVQRAPVEVAADPVRLTQLFGNLLQNARAFADDVTLRVERIDDAAVIEVIDDGPGVPAADVERVFEPFHSGRPDGVGLGLAIARSIAQAHGGTLYAAAGPGGHFTVSLPTEG